MAAKLKNIEINDLSEKIKDKFPFDSIVQNLEMTFGEPKLSPKSDPLAMLINIILSQATTGTNSRRTFRNLGSVSQFMLTMIMVMNIQVYYCIVHCSGL